MTHHFTKEGRLCFEPEVRSAEAHELDALDLETAKGILHQLGFFSGDTCFMSLRFTHAEWRKVAAALTNTTKPPEMLIAELCEQFTERENAKASEEV